MANTKRSTSRRWPSTTRLSLAALEDRCVPTIVLGTRFEGLDFPQSGGFVPPDTTGAVGQNVVVEAVNSTVAIYNKTNGQQQSVLDMDAFYNAPGADTFDPVVVYDDIDERFVVIALAVNDAAQTGALHVAVSNVPNPTNLSTDFTVSVIDVTQTTPSGAAWADYPKLGYNNEGYFVTLNMFAFTGGYVQTQIVAMDKTGAVTSQSTRDATNFTMASAVMHNATPGGPAWFVAQGGVVNTVRLTRMDNPTSATPTFVTIERGVNPYTRGGNPPAPQLGGFITTGDSRMMNAEMRGNRLVSTHAVNVGGETTARWYEFDTTDPSAPLVRQQGNVDPGAGVFTSYPSIAINADGNLGMTYMQSSATEAISMYVTGRTDFLPLNTMDTPVRARAGQREYQDFSPGFFRAGDYSAISVDPVNDSFWAFNEYATNAPTNNWGTYIAQFNAGPGTRIDGQVFRDTNGDGIRQLGLEFGLGNSPVQLLNNATNAIVDTANTDAFGNFSFVNFAPGTYRVAQPPSGSEFQTTTSPGPVTLAAGDRVSGLLFGNFQFMTYSGAVFEDLNGNGVFEPTETPLDDLLVRLFATSDPSTTINTKVTGADGRFSFIGLIPLANGGSYSVEQVPPGGFVTLSGTPGNLLTLSGNTQSAQIAYFRPVDFSGVVYNDDNFDGLLNFDETGVANWPIRLVNATTGVVVATTTTDPDGIFRFDDLLPQAGGADLIVEQTGPLSFQPTTVTSVQTPVRSGSNVQTLDFGLFQQAGVSGRVVNDTNANGFAEAGEPGLPGIAVSLLNGATGEVLVTVNTDANGFYIFAGLSPLSGVGTYRVQIPAQNGFILPKLSEDFTIRSGSNPTINFTAVRSGVVSGTIYNDVNGNGQINAGDAGLAGLTVQLVDVASNTAVASTTTNANGGYSLNVVPNVAYRLFVGLPTDRIATTSLSAFQLGSGGAAAINLGTFSLMTITGRVYDDANGNSVSDATDPGLAGQTVQLFNSSGVLLTSVKSAADGTYTFTQLPPATYRVRLVQPLNSVLSGAALADIPPVSGQTFTVNVGVFRLATINGRVVEDFKNDGVTSDDGGLAGAFVRLFDSTGKQVGDTFTDGAGNYSFANLGIGPFTVRVTPPLGYASTTGDPAVVLFPPSGGTATAPTFGMRTPTYLATGAESGGGPHVRVRDVFTGQEVFSFYAYDSSYKGGVRVALGDFNGDGVQDIITTPGVGGGPHVKVFSGVDLTVLASFYAYDASFTLGVFAASGDTNNDGFAEIITGAGAGGGPHVKTFAGGSGQEIQSFFAFDAGFTGGVRVASGDVNGDGAADIVVGAGPGGGPIAMVFDGTNLNLLQVIQAFDPSYTAGVFVTTADFTGSGRSSVIVSQGSGIGGLVSIFAPLDSSKPQLQFAGFPAPPVLITDESFDFGVRVGRTELGGGRQGLMVVGGPGTQPIVRVLDGNTGGELTSFLAYDLTFLGGVFLS